MKFPTILVAVFLLLAATSIPAQERIRIAWAGATPTDAPIWVVEERKLLKKHGLDGEIISSACMAIGLALMRPSALPHSPKV